MVKLKWDSILINLIKSIVVKALLFQLSIIFKEISILIWGIIIIVSQMSSVFTENMLKVNRNSVKLIIKIKKLTCKIYYFNFLINSLPET